MTWTVFADNYSGNAMKTEFNYIFIEGNKMEACDIFKKTFGFSACLRTYSDIPDGQGYHTRDYHIEETEDIVKYTMYQRRCDFDHAKLEFIERAQEEKHSAPLYKTFEQYMRDGGHTFEKVKFIAKEHA